MAASGTQITALHWETLDTEGPTRAEYQANWAAMDAHIHDGRGAGAPVRTITNTTVPAASGDVRVSADAFQWYGTSLHTAVDLATAQTLQNKTLDATNAFSSPLTVPNGGTGIASATAYAIICAGTTSTGPRQPLASLGTIGQLLQSNGAGALPSWTTGTLAGDVTGTIGATTIAAGAVTASKIATGAVGSGQVANGATSVAGQASVATPPSSTYSIGTGNWTAVDTTSLRVTITTLGGPVLCGFGLTARNTGSSAGGLYVGLIVDGVTGYRVIATPVAQNADARVDGTWLVTGLGAGSHTFDLAWTNQGTSSFASTTLDNLSGGYEWYINATALHA